MSEDKPQRCPKCGGMSYECTCRLLAELKAEREYSNRLYSLLSGYQDPPAPPARP